MYNFKKLILSAAVLLPAILYSSSILSIKSFFTTAEMKLAVSGEFLTSVSLKGKGEVHSPGVETFTPVKNSYIAVSSYGYDMAAVEKGFFPMEGNSSNRLKIFKSLTDFSLLKGMSYYSMTEGKNIPLVLESYRIQTPEDYIKENIKDKNIPESSLSHFAIKDNRLGLLTFKCEFICSGENFISVNTSTGNSSKFGMSIFYPGDYRIYKIFIYDRKLKGYFFYTVQYMKVRSSILSKIDLIKPESFGNRVRAENIHFMKNTGIDKSGKLAAFK